LHPDNFRRGEAIAPRAQRLGLWWRKNYQINAQKNKMSLDFFVLLDQAKRTNRKILRMFLQTKKAK